MKRNIKAKRLGLTDFDAVYAVESAHFNGNRPFFEAKSTQSRVLEAVDGWELAYEGR